MLRHHDLKFVSKENHRTIIWGPALQFEGSDLAIFHLVFKYGFILEAVWVNRKVTFVNY